MESGGDRFRRGFSGRGRLLRRHADRQDHQAQAVQLQPLQDFERGLIVQKAADEAVNLLAEDELTREKDRVPELRGDRSADRDCVRDATRNAMRDVMENYHYHYG